MTEYDILCLILNKEFMPESQDVMIENKENKHKQQCVKILDEKSKCLNRSLFRFDLEEKEFLPFFNKTDNSPEGLRKFCDYILLVEYKKKTYILLIELKRGETSGADKQLRASESFIGFLYTTATRLQTDFNNSNFDPKKIILRKIIIKACKSNKTETHRKKIDTTLDIIHFKSSGVFPLLRFLNENH